MSLTSSSAWKPTILPADQRAGSVTNVAAASAARPAPIEEGPQLFASPRSDPRGRRPVDALRAVADVLVLVLIAMFSVIAADLDQSASRVLTGFPGFLDALWLAAFWSAVGWTLALLVLAVVRGRWELTLEAVAAAVIGLGVAAVVAEIVTDTASAVFRTLADTNGPAAFAPGALVVTAAVIAVMAPFVTLPARRLGRALVAAQVLAAVFLGTAYPFGVLGAVAVGLLAGNVVHVVRGSPGGLPSVSRVETALRQLGVEIRHLAPRAMLREGAVRMDGSDARGPVQVKVYGRDAWEGELLADLWRRAWYRGGQRHARLSRGEYVEHEGFMTYLASSAGVLVPEVVTAGVADNGDAVIVLRSNGECLDDTQPVLTSEQIRSLWDQLGRLHGRGIVHRRLDLDRIVVGPDGAVGFSDLSSASVRSDEADVLADNAQLLTVTGLAVGRDEAIARARDALGDDGLMVLFPYLQEAAMPPVLSRALRHRDIHVEAIQKELVEQLDVPEEQAELVKLRRVTWKSLLNLGLLAFAAYTLIGMIAGIDLEAFGESLRDAEWAWLVGALVVGQLPRVANAYSTMGSTEYDLPLGPTTGLHFAICYVNLAVPSAAGRVAVTTRFFQRFGVPPATAVSASAIDSLSEFLTQIALFVLVFFASDIDLGLSLTTEQLSGLGTTVLIIFVVIVVAGGIALVVPALRTRVKDALSQAREALRVLRSPRKLAQLFGGNLMSQLLFAFTLGVCVRAFGLHVPLSALLLINSAVSLFAGLLPVPGGVGVTEAGLSLGLTRVGVPAETAFAIALCYRFVTFYLPPIWGYQSYRWLASHKYL